MRSVPQDSCPPTGAVAGERHSPGQHYEAGLITLGVNLASQIGLRPMARALRIIFKWLQVDARIPQHQSIRDWMQRIGLDRMTSVSKPRSCEQ